MCGQQGAVDRGSAGSAIRMIHARLRPSLTCKWSQQAWPGRNRSESSGRSSGRSSLFEYRWRGPNSIDVCGCENDRVRVFGKGLDIRIASPFEAGSRWQPLAAAGSRRQPLENRSVLRCRALVFFTPRAHPTDDDLSIPATPTIGHASPWRCRVGGVGGSLTARGRHCSASHWVHVQWWLVALRSIGRSNNRSICPDGSWIAHNTSHTKTIQR